MNNEPPNVEIIKDPKEFGKDTIYKHRYSKAGSPEYHSAKNDLFEIFNILDKLWKTKVIKWFGRTYEENEGTDDK